MKVSGVGCRGKVVLFGLSFRFFFKECKPIRFFVRLIKIEFIDGGKGGDKK
jgi:hypothetical protein